VEDVPTYVRTRTRSPPLRRGLRPGVAQEGYSQHFAACTSAAGLRSRQRPSRGASLNCGNGGTATITGVVHVPKLRIIHLSDLHFGTEHRFAAAPTINGDPVTQDRNFRLHDSLSRDWAGLRDAYDRDVAQLVALTGDLTCGAVSDEFNAAHQFVNALIETPVLGKPCNPAHIFVVPGNHDVAWEEKNPRDRMQRYLSWYNDLGFAEQIRPSDYRRLSQIRIFNDSRVRALIVELNSCLYVEKDRPDANRGRIDDSAIHELETALNQLPAEVVSKSFRILMLHHHPILLPAFAEAGRGYDAMENAGPLLALLRRNRFHLVLHGHKHLPRFEEYHAGQGFLPLHHNAWKTLVAGGGSAGAVTGQLPTSLPGATNTYSILELHTDDNMEVCGIRVELRALQLHADNDISVPQSMQWATMTRARFHAGNTAQTQSTLAPDAEVQQQAGSSMQSIPKPYTVPDTASIIRALSVRFTAIGDRAGRNSYYSIALQDTLATWRAKADELAKGELPLYDSVGTNNVVRNLYRYAKSRVFSTCAKQYLDQWPTKHGQSLLAAHRASSAEVTRVFLFKNWQDVSDAAAEIMAQQADQGINVLAFIDDDSDFDWPQELTRDFTVIDDGAAIGTTTAFLNVSGEPLTQATWYFENTERMPQYETLIRTLMNESLDYDTLREKFRARSQ
jgi:3',5'-cyclic AMP phosphodiesterase CpdA